jgi:hypothetical protein
MSAYILMLAIASTKHYTVTWSFNKDTNLYKVVAHKHGDLQQTGIFENADREVTATHFHAMVDKYITK